MKKFFLALASAALVSLQGFAVDGFKVSGTKLLDPTGTEFVMRGVNYSYAWQRGNENSVIPAAASIGCNAIRLQLATGERWQKCTTSDVEKLIKLCRQNKLICVLNIHDHTGSNNTSDLDKAVAYWKEMKTLLNANKDIVLVNIDNEWGGDWESSRWTSGYVKAVKDMRDAGIENTLIVDAAGYGQYPASIGAGGRQVLAADPDGNTVFSVHIYDDAGKDANTARESINYGLRQGLCTLVGEFAYKHKGKDVAYQTVMDFCEEKKVGYLVWSWTGNSSDVADCDMFAGYDASNYKPNGTYTVKGTNGIKATSKLAAIYSGEISVDPGTDTPVSGKEGVIATSNITDGATGDWTNIIEIPASLFADVKAGDIVRITGTSSGNKPEIQVAYKADDADWSWTILQDHADFIGTYEYFVSDDADELAGLKAHGMYLKGANSTFTKAELVRKGADDSGVVVEPGGEEKPDEPGTDTPSGDKSGVIASETISNGETGGWSNIVEIPASLFADVKKGDIVRFTGKGASDGQIQINYKMDDSDWTWTTLVEYDDFTGSYDYTVSGDADELAGLKAHGMYLKGQNATITKAELIRGGAGSTTTPDDPSVEPGGDDKKDEPVVEGDWQIIATAASGEVQGNWDNEVHVEAGNFVEAIEGDRIRLTFSGLGTGAKNPQVQFVVKLEGREWTELYKYADITGTTFTFDLTDAQIADCDKPTVTVEEVVNALLLDGLYLKGQWWTLDKCELLRKNNGAADTDVIVNTHTAGSGNAIETWSSTEYHVPASVFANAKETDYVRVHVEKSQGAQYQAAVKVGSNWTWTQLNDADDILRNYFDLDFRPASAKVGMQKASASISQSEFIDALKLDGLYLKGQKYTIKKVELRRKGDTSAVESIFDAAEEAIDFDQPVEIYTLQGVRVADMDAKGIYIVRQGNKVKKIAK